MKLEGTTNIKASREKVWEFITDPDQVAKCAPGLESMEIIEPDKKFLVVAAIGFGAVKIKFKMDVEFVELKAPDFASLKVHGNAPGSAVDATSEMKLSDGENGSTDLNWSADVVVLGTIASLASRLMGSVTKKLANEFFTKMKDYIEE